MTIIKMDSFDSKSEIATYFCAGETKYYRISGLDTDVNKIESDLFFKSNNDIEITENSIEVPRKTPLDTNSFRNSLYLACLKQFTNINSLSLLISYQGLIRLKIYQAEKGQSDKLLQTIKLYSAKRTYYLNDIEILTSLKVESRIYWQIEALSNTAILYGADYLTTEKPKECRIAVLLRTYGRTDDIKTVLKNFVDTSQKNAYYASILEHFDFWVLDTTPNCENEYQEPWQEELNLRVLVAPNLGGGGNAGHLLALFRDACLNLENPPTEIVIMDDDLRFSMESLARYFMFCAYKREEVICSVPILMKSRPGVIWEDGGFWGRRNFEIKERSIFPSLIKHGLNVTGMSRKKIKNIEEFSVLNICEYSTFIFFGLSIKALEKIGYPAAFFLRGDDIEFSLRANKLNIPLITNPNLAAWHEPAHSYSQEYMAILHGIIINLTYGSENAEYYATFFQDRLFEHISINDQAGISVYRAILADLIDTQSPVLSADFAAHYIEQLKVFAGIKMTQLSESEQTTFENNARKNKELLVPFVYPGYHHDIGKRFKGVIALNHSFHSYREIPALSAGEKNEIILAYMNLLADFTNNFDTICLNWQKKLVKASGDDYWMAIKKRYSEVTQVIYENKNTNQDSCITIKHEDTTSQEKKESIVDLGLDKIKQILGSLPKKVQLKKIKTNLKQKKATLDTSNLPADFDSDVYLQINQDVNDAGIDPVEHYLKFGMKEGRKYWF